MEPSPDKVKSVQDMDIPKNKEDVQSFLGMVNYSSRFIRNFSTLSEPLRRLTHKGQDFVWGEDQSKAFDSLKQALSSKPVIKYFDVNKESELLVDASPFGLGAMLIQYDRDGTAKVVAYVSRALTPTIQKYAQIEREALAVVWACEHFNLYIFGKPITVATDHKPLVSLLGSPTAKLPMRLERWMLRLQPYSPFIRYQKESSNPVDYLSRHPLPIDVLSSEHESIAEEYVNFVTSQSVPKALNENDILKETLQDDTLNAVKMLHETNKWYLVDQGYDFGDYVQLSSLRSFSKVRHELSVTASGLVLKGGKLVIPANLQQTVNLAHEGHQGLSKTKALLREKIWFPGIDSFVSDVVSRCIACRANFDAKPREPLKMTPLPSRPWSDISVDFYGPLPYQEYLLGIKDENSCFPEVEIVRSTSANTVIPVLDKVFSSRGMPTVVKSDNGPPFQSDNFKQYAEQMGFKHQKVTPYWPEANGSCENFMKSLGKSCKNAQLEGRPWQQELFNFLRNYRATPYSSTGIAPATLLNGYPMKTKLPELSFTRDDCDVRGKDFDSKMKMKHYAERRRNITHSEIGPGNKVLIRNHTKFGKLEPKFQKEPFEVIDRKGSMIVAKRGDEIKARNACHFKRIVTSDDPLRAHNEKTDDLLPPEENQGFLPPEQFPVKCDPVPVPDETSTTTETHHTEKESYDENPTTSPRSDQNVSKPTSCERPVRNRKAPSYLKDYHT